MPNSIRPGDPVTRADGVSGAVVAEIALNDGTTGFEILFADASRFVVSRDTLVRQADGSYLLPLEAADVTEVDEEMVIPVVAEQLVIEKARVARGKVRVNKRVETYDEVVDTPVTSEEVVVERILVNRLVEGEPPQVHEEADLIVIPLIDEVLVVEKRLMVREEVRISKRRTTTSTPQTITLRREVVDIEREELSGEDSSEESK